MKRNSPRTICSFFLVVSLGVALCMTAAAQPAADKLFEDGKRLATSGSPDDQLAAIKKFDDALLLYRANGATGKADEVELEYGRLLKTIAVREFEEKQYESAVDYFERALKKFVAIRNALETAYTCHNLGYAASDHGLVDRAIEYYNCAGEAYKAAGDKDGQAIIFRNTALVQYKAKKYEDAAKSFESALQMRAEMGQQAEQALLNIEIGDCYSELKKYDSAVPRYEEALRLYRALKDMERVAASLLKLSLVPSSAMKFADAAAYAAEARKICETTKDRTCVAVSVWTLGRLHMSNVKPQEAEKYLILAADMFGTLQDQLNEGYAALDLAVNYQSLSRYAEVNPAAERALKQFREKKDKIGEAYALLISAEAKSFLSQHADALARIQSAKQLFQEAEFREADYRIARALATHYYVLSNYGEAIKYGQIALKEGERLNDADLKATAYVDIGISLSQLGENQKSIEYNSKALEFARKIANRNTESICLSNIGYAYFKLGEYSQAEKFLNEAIVIMKANGYDHPLGYATHNLGLVYYKRREYSRALVNYEQALLLYRKVGDRRPEAFVYDSFGETYRDLGQFDKAIENLQKSIVLAREIKYSEIEGNALSNMMTFWERKQQPRLAILYGKQAVNVYQSIRASNRNVDKSAQKTLVESNEKTYRQLANLLIEDGRLPEAQQVLDLLKSQEYFEFVRRDASEADEHASLALSESERRALEEYSRVSASLTALGAQFQTLQDKRNKSGGKLSETEEAEYLKLKKQVEDAGEGLKTFFSKLSAEFSKKVEDGTVVTPQSIETLKADLRRAGPDVVLVSTYLLPERYRAIVTTGRTMVDRKVEYSALKLTGSDVNRKIFEFQRALQNPNVDPRVLGKELYDIFVKPLEGDLRGAGAKTILWSLDGSLRYIPIAALSPDGKTYFAEQYQNVVVTLGRQTNLFAKPATEEWRAIGAGVSKQHAGFSALPSVPEEIGSIVRDAKHTAGVLDGTQMLDEQFNLESLRTTVPQQTDDGRPFNVLHLATHFSLGASDQDSALLLGDGTRLSLFDIARDEALDFKDVELLTLSACQTGVSTGDANGREVESLGMLAQKKGAKAVLATLWKVADESTSLFMADFYRIKKANPNIGKAEAIRLAQKEMIEGKIKSSGKSAGCRSEAFTSGSKQKEFKCDPNAPFSHPYFWSPFVLIGNWR